jgi:uncharacterized protein (UPF0335 family)
MSVDVGADVSADQLRAFIQRVESLNEEITARNEDKSAVFAEAKSAGFDVPVLKEIVKRRAKDPDKRHEFEAILELYLARLGDFAS